MPIVLNSENPQWGFCATFTRNGYTRRSLSATYTKSTARE